MTTRPRRATMLLVAGAGVIIGAGLMILLPLAPRAIGNSDKDIPPDLVSQLTYLGLQALKSRDVPVAALLLYGDSIIGEGYNTVLRDNNAGGHAEINAISDALHRRGATAFSKLDRDSLLLISTFEPCSMCLGAILEYRVHHVRYLKAKPFLYLFQEELRALLYRLRLQESGPESVQDSLFSFHPDSRSRQ
jgi:tRNA(Arg) A34 adenosine deaminase TadA